MNKLKILACCVIAATLTLPASAQKVTLKYSGALAQSQPAGSDPLAVLSMAGVTTDGQGQIWTGGGTDLYAFRSEGGKLKLVHHASAPTGLNPSAHLMSDGERLYYASWDNAVYSIDPAQPDVKAVRFCTLPANWRAVAMAPAKLTKGFAAKCKLVVLLGATVNGIAADGGDAGAILTLPPPAQGAPYYYSVGFEPSSGDLLVGGYYPDVNVYRFSVDGAQVKDGGWPRNGFAQMIVSVNGTPWMLAMGGGAQSMPTPLDPATVETIDRDWTFYGAGLVKDNASTYWYATSQGLCHFDGHGKPLHQRIGALPGVTFAAINSDGTVIAGIEKGGRLARLSLDDEADGALASNGNEPWHIGANWTSHAPAIAADGATFLVLDDKAKQLWRFDPAQADKNQNPWLKIAAPLNLATPRALAVGDAYVWILDGSNVIEAARADLSGARTVSLAGSPALAFLASAGDSALAVADAQSVSAYARKGDGSYALLWKSTASFDKIAGIAASAAGVAVSDSSGVTLLDAKTGGVAAKLDAATLPGGATLGAIAAQGSWLVAADDKNARLVRLRVAK
ncbi:MAG: hypothetical protein P4L33_03995 [Capsulimonadaceae bacterium]|nr:hypothetical protein [Capsulimonadaceae bacterium]